jgi:hypothetical protein
MAAKPLVPLTIEAPGFYGLNTQQGGAVLPPGWATVLSNTVFDASGRISARNGSRQQNGTVITSTPTIYASHEYVDAVGNRVNIIACDNKIYKEVAGTMTDVSGTITTPTGDDWQFVNFNGWCVGFQNGHNPIVATSATTPVFADSGGTQYDGDMGLSAYGRLWTVYQNTLYYSDLLINDFTGGSSGNFDLAKYWPNGMDEAVALIDFNGYLVVFGKESIIVYENADDVTVMSIVEGIDGVGCPYRDSVQMIGKEVVFMSSTGLRGLGRTLQDGGMPLGDFSKHVRDQLLIDISGETAVNVKSVYNRKDGFYLLSLPAAGFSYMFDTKQPLEDGAWRSSNWDIAPTAMNYTEALEMHIAVEAGYLSEYTGWRDGDDSAGTGGASYTLNFEGVWNDFGEQVGPLNKLLKSVTLVGAGQKTQPVSFKWAVDYGGSFVTVPMTFSTATGAVYGTATWATTTYSARAPYEKISANIGRAGQVVKSGISTEINGSSFSLQRIHVLAKVGRLGL